MNENLTLTMKADADLVNEALKNFYLREDKELDRIISAEKYSVLAGGKRIRPIIALAFCRLFGGDPASALPYAIALEMIHTASLIHDDLPCIDNDDLRRGRPTNHKVYGESTALLAGDGLLMDAFGVVAKNTHLSAELNLQAVIALSEATGTFGLVGGEFIDIEGESRRISLDELRKMDSLKTGALIKASAVLGAIAAGVELSDRRMEDVKLYAENIGHAFQVIDDVLDATGTAEELGKNPGQDEKENKTTYLSFYTVDEAISYAEKLTDEAISAIEKYERCEFLRDLAKYLISRKN